ncbi:MAG: DNA-3-methyladenine glycosylase 2 family protein [Oscillospiraceae bacterium]
MDRIFAYTEVQTDYLKSKDEKLAKLIDFVGKIERKVTPELYSAMVDSIMGQQISTAAHSTIRQRLKDGVGEITPNAINEMSRENLQAFGLSWRKTDYIKDFTKKIVDGDFHLETLKAMSDEQVIKELLSLKGVGRWTAEMLMTFSMERMDVLSYGDLGIRRGICRLYGLETLSEKEFSQLTDKFSPYRSVAALYFWAYAAPDCGTIEGED